MNCDVPCAERCIRCTVREGERAANTAAREIIKASSLQGMRAMIASEDNNNVSEFR